jgi:hypothetical protein
MVKRLLAGAFVLTLALSGCSDDDDGGDLATDLENQDDGDESTTTTEPTETTEDSEPETTETTDDTETTDTTTGGGGLGEAEVEAGVEEALADSLGGLTGGTGGDIEGLDEDSLACLVETAAADPALLESLLAASDDPTYVYDGATMAATFALLVDCDSVDAVAEQIAAESGGTMTAESASCMVEGMAGISPETWDAIMGGGDPTSLDPQALSDLMTIFTTCDIDPTTL